MKNVAFFFQCHCYSTPKETKRQQKPNEEHEDSDDAEECEEVS